MDTYEVTTLKRGLLILDVLRNRQSLTMSEIMQELSLNKASAFRMLHTLEKMNYVVKCDKYYQLNPRIFRYELGDWHNGVQWTSIAAPYHLARNVGEKVVIGILDQYELVIKNVIKEPFTETIFTAIDNRRPVHSSALGKVILAHLSKEKQCEILNYISLVDVTENTFIDKELFIPHLHVIKTQGYAFDDEETDIGIRCIAAPVYLNNEVIGAIAINGSVERITKNSIRSLAKKVISASKQVTIELENYENEISD